MNLREGGGTGAERKETKAHGGQGTGGESGQAEPEHGRAEAGKESAPLSGMAGGRGEERVEADGGADGEAGHPHGNRHGGIRRILPGVCQMERVATCGNNA